jgi:hypothetical protein
MADGSTAGGLYGYVSLILGGVVAILVARISRTRDDEPDLSTVEGLAAELVRVRRRLSTLEAERERDVARLGAEQRYRRSLVAAFREQGLPVPEPDPADAALLLG